MRITKKGDIPAGSPLFILYKSVSVESIDQNGQTGHVAGCIGAVNHAF
jgi:hypothetical protein